ncbi:MAG: hypothetical protein Q9213_004672 [Squamulea squamosa]
MTTKDLNAQDTLTNNITTSEEKEITYPIPFINNLKITITPNHLHPLTYPELHSCLISALNRAKLWEPKVLTPNRYRYHLDAKTNLQFGIGGDLLWGVNQLYWGDIVEILFGLIQWTFHRERRKEKAVEFSFTVSEEGDVNDDSGKKSRGEIATGYLTRKA